MKVGRLRLLLRELWRPKSFRTVNGRLWMRTKSHLIPSSGCKIWYGTADQVVNLRRITCISESHVQILLSDKYTIQPPPSLSSLSRMVSLELVLMDAFKRFELGGTRSEQEPSQHTCTKRLFRDGVIYHG